MLYVRPDFHSFVQVLRFTTNVEKITAFGGDVDQNPFPHAQDQIKGTPRNQRLRAKQQIHNAMLMNAMTV